MSEDDITSLPVHHCYVRATVGRERLDAFSMEVRKPEEGDPDRAARIRAGAAAYVTTDRDLAADQAESKVKAKDYHDGLNDLRTGGKKEEPETGTEKDDRKASEARPKNKPRTRNPKDSKEEGDSGSGGAA